MNCYDKIIQISNALYNQGLAKANVRDLSGAADSLNLSLRYYKANTQARNLLGLVYYEMGETVKALGEWVISTSLQPEDNDADQYLTQMQSEQSVLSATNQTIKKYNQALGYCKNGDEDLAILQLKKVLSLNPKLIKAYQLLALVYLHQEQYAQAKDILRKAGRIDTNNTTTLRYLKEANSMLRGGKGSEKAKEKKKNADLAEDSVSYTSGNETIIRPSSFTDNTALTTVVNLVIGVAIGFLISYFLIVPSSRKEIKSEVAADLIEANNTITTKNATIKNLESQMDDMKDQVTEAQNASSATEDEITCYKQMLVAYQSYTEGDYETAGEKLAKTDESQVSDDMKDTYEAIASLINDKYASYLYSDASSEYNQGNYEKAIKYFVKIMAIDEDYNDGNAMYYLAQSYRKNDKWDKAEPLYEKLVENYPGTQKAYNAQSYLDTYGN